MLGRLTKSMRRLATAATEASSSLSGTTSLPWFPEPIRLHVEPLKFQLLSRSNIPEIFSSRARHIDSSDYLAAAAVFPMRANNYVVDNLINWTNVPEDPIFLLTFPQPDMLSKDDLYSMKTTLSDGSSKVTQRELAESIRRNLNPHPGNQKEENVPSLHGKPLEGLQHKYRETCLVFPTEGQYCHSYCTYCFRWAQFTAVGSSQQFQSKDVAQIVAYLKANRDISDVLITGGDPMVMHTHQLARYFDAILAEPGCDHLATIRIGTKSLAYWPYRYVTDQDAPELLRLFEKVAHSGRQLSVMAHFSHPVELEKPVVQEAIRRIRMTGANVRCQAPLIRRINDDPAVWADMWRRQTRLGAIPYYMFIERDTGARHYFEVPLARAYEIYTTARSSVAGTARQAHGPSMTISAGKLQILGIAVVPTSSGPSKVFVMRFLQSRDPEWTKQVFFTEYNENATWFDQLKPAFGAKEYFFEKEYKKFRSLELEGSSGQMFPLEGSMKYDYGKVWSSDSST